MILQTNLIYQVTMHPGKDLNLSASAVKTSHLTWKSAANKTVPEKLLILRFTTQK
jgi:hypothetical protein